MIKYPLATSTWDDLEKNAAKSVIDSGMCTMGEKTKLFEKEFSKFIKSKYAVFCNSGSSANLLAITALMYRKNGNKLNFGDEVIVPAVSWSTTYYPLHQNRLKIKFVDVDINTLNIDINQIESAITDKTKAIMLVHLLGNPCNMTKILELCKKYNLLLIEDTCESLGATFNNQYCGTFGEIGTFSTFFSHHMATIEGGMCVTNDEELYQIMVSLRAHGWTRGLPDKNFICDKTGDIFEDSFKFILPGYNLRPNEVFSAIGLEQLKKLPEFIKERDINSSIFKNLLFNYYYGIRNKIIIQKIEEKCKSSWFGFSIILNEELSGKRKQITKILIDNGIECRPIVAGNFAKNPVINYMDYSIHNTLENSEKIDRDGLFIGNNPEDLSKQLKYFFEIFSKGIKSL